MSRQYILLILSLFLIIIFGLIYSDKIPLGKSNKNSLLIAVLVLLLCILASYPQKTIFEHMENKDINYKILRPNGSYTTSFPDNKFRVILSYRDNDYADGLKMTYEFEYKNNNWYETKTDVINNEKLIDNRKVTDPKFIERLNTDFKDTYMEDIETFIRKNQEELNKKNQDELNENNLPSMVPMNRDEEVMMLGDQLKQLCTRYKSL